MKIETKFNIDDKAYFIQRTLIGNKVKCETCGHYTEYPEESEWKEELVETTIEEIFVYIYFDNEIEEMYDILPHQTADYIGANLLFKTPEEAWDNWNSKKE